MKQIQNNTKKMTANYFKKHSDSAKKASAKARRKVYESWQKVEATRRYQKAVIKDVCDMTTQKIEIEVLDGILLNLNYRNQGKSQSVQNRILRRIVEKRQAQAAHKKNGRSKDLSSLRISISCISRCMEDIRKRRFAA